MRRKLLAFVLAFAIALSLFPSLGVTAAETYSHKILLDTTSMVAGGSIGFKTIQGSVVTKDGYYDGKDFDIRITAVGGTFSPDSTRTTGGSFSFILPTDLPAQDVAVRAYRAGTDDVVAVAHIKVRYNVSTTPADLSFSYSTEGPGTFIIGKVTDAKGQPVSGASVDLRQTLSGNPIKYYAPAGLTTSVNGEFGILVSRWEYVGDLELLIDGYVHKTGRVGGIQAKLNITPNSNVAHTIAPTYFTVQGSGFSPQGGYVNLTIKRNSEEVKRLGSVYAGTSGTFTANFTWLPTEAGSYTLEAIQGTYSASTTITVVNPSGYNFINTEQLTSLRIGDASRNQMKVGKPDGAYLVTWDGSQMVDSYYYDVYVDGELVVEKRANATFGMDVDQFGTKTIRVVAFRQTWPTGSSSPVYNYVHEKTFVAKVTGWNVTVSASTLTVNETRDITFVVKDENGTPMNNATIRFGQYELSPYNYNAQNGTYVFKDVRFTTAGPVSVVIKQGDVEKAQLTLNVVGQKVYNLTSGTNTLLQGHPQTVRFNVSKDNQALMPQVLEMEDSKGKVTVVPFTVVSTSGSYAIIDAVITPELVGDLLVRARNFTGTECGEVKLNVVAPKLVLVDTDAKNVTENIKTKVRFKVVDPRDNSTLESNVSISANYASILVYDAYDFTVWNNTLLGAPEHTISILATDAQYESASDAKAEVAVVLKVNDVPIGSFPIKPATLESDPNMIVIGAPTPLTLTYKDANGKPIADKMVQVQEGSSYVNIDRTDSSGKVIYNAIQGYGVSLAFRAATDVSQKYVQTEVRYGYDNMPPQVSYEKEVTTSKTTIVITDNVRVLRVRINGEEIEDLFAGKRYEHTLELKPGINRFRIQAQDNNYNYLDETIEINYVTSSQEPTTGLSVKYTIGKTTYYVDGKAYQLEAAPFLRGNHTLVPVRALASIGATFAWDPATRTATFQLAGNVVKVTIGKSTAIVNDKATPMPIAAEIVNGRTMVPFRFVGQSLGLRVDYLAATRDIIITRE